MGRQGEDDLGERRDGMGRDETGRDETQRQRKHIRQLQTGQQCMQQPCLNSESSSTAEPSSPSFVPRMPLMPLIAINSTCKYANLLRAIHVLFSAIPEKKRKEKQFIHGLLSLKLIMQQSNRQKEQEENPAMKIRNTPEDFPLLHLQRRVGAAFGRLSCASIGSTLWMLGDAQSHRETWAEFLRRPFWSPSGCSRPHPCRVADCSSICL